MCHSITTNLLPQILDMRNQDGSRYETNERINLQKLLHIDGCIRCSTKETL